MYEMAIGNKTIWPRNFRLNSVLLLISFFSLVLVGCSWTSLPPSEVVKGSSRVEVFTSFGEPDQTQEFILLDEPFFGPQESLINLVPSGTLIEEWVYEIGDEVLYVWFTGQVDELRDNWVVLDTARYPKDAVY